MSDVILGNSEREGKERGKEKGSSPVRFCVCVSPKEPKLLQTEGVTGRPAWDLSC